MLRNSTVAGCPHIEVSVKELLIEDAIFDQSERRTIHREYLVRPVLLELRDSDHKIEGFTRNISYLGVSIVTRIPILPQTIAKILVYRLNTSPGLFLAECRWTSPFGEDWNVTGWNFLNVDQSKLQNHTSF
jgi:hypothetical protein